MTKYAFFSAPAHGHVNPTLAIVQELVARGEQVVYYLPEEFRHTIEANGATFHNLDIVESAHAKPGGSSGAPGMMGTMMTSLPAILSRTVDSLRLVQPDCIVYDFMALWGQMAAQILHIPAVCLRPSYAPSESLKRSMREKMLPGPGQRPGFPLQPFKEMQAQLDKIYASNNGPSAPIMTSLFESFGYAEQLNICLIPRAFQPDGETLDERFLFVGPAILPRHEEVNFPFEQLDERSLLYISLGTAFNNRADIYNACFKAFGHTQWQVVLSRGKNVDPAVLDPTPANFIVADYVPQLELLPHTSVFISHGGMNSTMESLYYGVPLVVLPQMGEQEMTAQRIQELGLGVALNSKEVSANDLLRAVQQITNDATFGERVHTMQQAIHDAGGYHKAVDAIIQYTHQRG
jgi:MGT family glycosyltransferase